MYLLEALNSLPQCYEFLDQSLWTTILPFVSPFIDIPLFAPHNFFPSTHTQPYPQSLRNEWVCKEGHRGELKEGITLMLASVITYYCQKDSEVRIRRTELYFLGSIDCVTTDILNILSSVSLSEDMEDGYKHQIC